MKKFVLGILAFIWLGFWTIFAQNTNILPDGAEISVKDPVTMWEATNLKITIMKNGSVMRNYNGSVRIMITNEDGTVLNKNEYVVPSNWTYDFLASDQWVKEFQRWLEIKKEWKFYIEVQDLNANEDKVLWRELITVVRKKEIWELKHIDVYYPNPNASLIGEKVEIIATCTDLPNSNATIYIDNNRIAQASVALDGSISYTIPNVAQWQHELFIEIPDSDWDVIGTSDKVFFTISPAGNNGIKSVMVNPEKGLMVWDSTDVTAYTDDLIETVKMRLSDRPENDAMVMSKNWNWEFSVKVFLLGTWDVSLSFDTSASNNTVNNSYDNYKTIKVSDLPSVYNLKADTDKENRTADVTWETYNSSVVTSYYVYWWVEWTNLSWEKWTQVKKADFDNVPYDTVVKLNVTPYRNNTQRHWAASETIKFIISKNSVCGNWVCEDWETPETCPQDCWPVCGNWICEEWESHETCPQDCDWDWGTTIILWLSCPQKRISVRTSKVWDSHYLIWDKVDEVKKYVIYSSSTPDGKNKTKVYETTDTSYEYPFDRTSKEDVFMYFWIIWVCEDGEEVELTWATKVQVWPAENFFLLVCLTLLIYAWIKLFRQTE